MGTQSWHEGLLRRLEDGESIASAPMNFLVLRFRALVLCDCVATFITLLLVPVLYAIFVLDLKLVTWAGPASGPEGASIDSKGEPH